MVSIPTSPLSVTGRGLTLYIENGNVIQEEIMLIAPKKFSRKLRGEWRKDYSFLIQEGNEPKVAYELAEIRFLVSEQKKRRRRKRTHLPKNRT